MTRDVDQAELHAREQLATSLVPHAARLAAAVREEGPAAVAQVLALIPPDLHTWQAFAVVLAAGIDPDRSLSDTFGWLDPAEQLPPRHRQPDIDVAGLPASLDESAWTPAARRAAHAAYARGDRRYRVIAGERIYQRNRTRTRTAPRTPDRETA